jgi:hypothetical protein
MMAQYIPLATIEARIKKADEQWFALMNRIDALAAEKKLLQSLRREAIALDGENTSRKRRPEQSPHGHGLSINDAILSYLHIAGPATSAEIAKAVHDEGFARGSKDPRKTIQTLLGQLRTKGRVLRDDAGRFTLP